MNKQGCKTVDQKSDKESLLTSYDGAKKSYSKPVLLIHGKVKNLTAAGSMGMGMGGGGMGGGGMGGGMMM